MCTSLLDPPNVGKDIDKAPRSALRVQRGALTCAQSQGAGCPTADRASANCVRNVGSHDCGRVIAPSLSKTGRSRVMQSPFAVHCDFSVWTLAGRRISLVMRAPVNLTHRRTPFGRPIRTGVQLEGCRLRVCTYCPESAHRLRSKVGMTSLCIRSHRGCREEGAATRERGADAL
jgi:hypothetical protein